MQTSAHGRICGWQTKPLKRMINMVTLELCVVDGCDKPQRYGDLCGMHYKRKWRHGNAATTHTPTRGMPKLTCSVEDCESIADSKGMCKAHYLRWTRYGRLHTVVNCGSGWTVNAAGYIMLWQRGKWQYEHIILAEKALGKPLPKGAVVHHTGKVHENEGPFKLVVCPSQSYHMLLHKRMRELGCGEDN